MVINNSAVRKALEKLNNCTYSVLEWQAVKNPTTGITKHQEVNTQGGLSGKLSFSTAKQAQEGQVNSTAQQIVKLFYEPHINIKAGSKIVVVHKGSTYQYKNSSEPLRFENHNEIVLEKFVSWS